MKFRIHKVRAPKEYSVIQLHTSKALQFKSLLTLTPMRFLFLFLLRYFIYSSECKRKITEIILNEAKGESKNI